MTTRIRVLQVIPAFTVGGGEWMATYLAACLDSERFDSHLLSLHAPRQSPMEQYLVQRGVPIHSLYKRSGFQLSAYLKLVRLLRQLHPEIVHTHQTVGRYVYPICRFMRPPLIVHTVHNVASKEISAAWARRIQAWGYRWGVQPVAIAEEVSRSFYEAYGRPVSALIPNGIPVEHYTPDLHARLAWRQQENIDNSTCVIVCVAGLRHQKNHSLLLRAYARLAAVRRDVLLLLVGAPDPHNPEHAERLRQLAQSLGIWEQVRFMGGRADVPAILNASDIFVLASTYEGNPLSVMEAMAAGLPPVCTAVGGVPELITHEQTGLLVPSEDEIVVTEALERLVNDPNMRQQLGQAARAYALQYFDVSAMARAYERFYLERLELSDKTDS